MSFVVSPRLVPLSLITSILLAQGCNWVDSTGRQDNSTPTSELQDGDVFAKLEEDSFDINASAVDEDGVVQSYSWNSASSQGALDICESSFDSSLAADSLSEVCEDQDNCEIIFVEDEDSSGLFHVLLPKITAPIGLTHELTVEDNDGGRTTLTAHFCIDSVNEAPIAGDDQYSVSEGETLIVDALAGNGLLQNDSDDLDVRNSGELVVLGVADAQGPAHASEFTLETDGSFTYAISPLTAFTVKQDTFTYEVYDGHSIALGSVVLDLSVEDDPPQPIGIIPNQTAVVGLFFGPLNISGKFFDPENSDLSYSAIGLPTGVSLNAQSGIISGDVAATNPIQVFSVTVSAFDGQNSVSHTPFDITLQENQAPIVSTPLANQTGKVGVALSINAASSFSDPESQTLKHSQTGLPTSLTIDTNGQISGTPITTDIGSHLVTITAFDGVSSVDMSFSLEVIANEAPEFSGPILGIPNASVATAYSHDVSQYFSDPENDAMTFTVTGLPASNNLTMSAAGVISGTPTIADRTGIFGMTLSVTATDSHGNTTIGDLDIIIL